MKEGRLDRKIYLGPHHMPTVSFSVIQNWWRTQKTTFTGIHCQERYSSQVLTSHWMQQVYHFHTVLSPPHPPSLGQTVRWLNINTRFGHLFFLLKVESGKIRYSNSSLNVPCVVAQSYPTLCDPMDSSSSVHGDSPGKNTAVGCHALLQGIFPTQESNPSLPHCRQILLPFEPREKPFTEQ